MLNPPAMSAVTVDDWAELARAAGSGDRDAQEAILERIRVPLLRYGLTRLGQLQAAEDFAQEVSLTVLATLPRYEERSRPFLAFVYGVAERKLSEHRRAARRRPEAPVERVPERPDPAAGPEELAIAAESLVRMEQLLAALPDREAEILRMRVGLGFSGEQTAAALGMTVGAVRVAQHRALAKLRALLIGEVST